MRWHRSRHSFIACAIKQSNFSAIAQNLTLHLLRFGVHILLLLSRGRVVSHLLSIFYVISIRHNLVSNGAPDKNVIGEHFFYTSVQIGFQAESSNVCSCKFNTGIRNTDFIIIICEFWWKRIISDVELRLIFYVSFFSFSVCLLSSLVDGHEQWEHISTVLWRKLTEQLKRVTFLTQRILLHCQCDLKHLWSWSIVWWKFLCELCCDSWNSLGK